ncbi:hypothetical protein NQ315_000347 [Exocentrus adspersus]|uniref:Complex III subunit 9 n=1 Tax=Exocentrus adspersus TaxID=1586481 RepID=A0AAV8VRP2_9CUCU|nr:hypothetical protein NQ315_000347 [Exocentrus adspersus]
MNLLTGLQFSKQFPKKMGFQQTVYNLVFKRTSTMALACVASVFFFERTFDLGSEYFFDKINEGKLWKHIKDKSQ